MVLPTLARAGMEIVAGRLAIGLTESGHEVSIACIEASGPIAEELWLRAWRWTSCPLRGSPRTCGLPR